MIQLGDAGLVQGSSRGDISAALCDGMGGHEAGEVAARIAASIFLRSLHERLISRDSIGDAMLGACEEANDTIAREIAAHPELEGMGTTLVGIWYGRNLLRWVSVGDSHLLLVRDGRIVKLNQDHSMRPVLDAMAVQNIISSAEAASHPDRNALRSVLNGDPVKLIDRGISGLRLRPGDIFIVASDGIDDLKPQLILRVLRSYFIGVAGQARKIVSMAAELGGKRQDNTTLMLFKVTG